MHLKTLWFLLLQSEILEGDSLSRNITRFLLLELDFADEEKDTIRKEVDKFLLSDLYTEVCLL